MNKIKELTNVIRAHAECELDPGTIKTLSMIDKESERITELEKDSARLDRLEKLRNENVIEIGDSLLLYVGDLRDFIDELCRMYKGTLTA